MEGNTLRAGKRYQVIVGNVGTVLETSDVAVASQEYQDYVAMSRNGYGRAAGEPVTLMADGSPLQEYSPEE